MQMVASKRDQNTVQVVVKLLALDKFVKESVIVAQMLTNIRLFPPS
tara:strand:- start:14 stop:151 length:138 start_codon:yes stop_codon:yes gene_type:complete